MVDEAGAVKTTKRVGSYRLGRILGKGAFGRVVAAVHVETNQNVAIKILKREEIIQHQMTDNVKNEIDVLRRLGRHDNIVSMLNLMATPTRIYIVMELVLGGELLYHIEKRPFTEPQACYYFRQLLRGIDFCHRHGVCHRDIKPENMLLTDSGVLKITDYGLAVVLDRSMIVRGVAGTPSYMAPEVDSPKGYEGFPADIWSCGIVLYLFLTGRLPFQASGSLQLREKIRYGKFSYLPNVTPLAQDLINSILIVDPRKRADIPTITKHEWIKRISEKGVITPLRQDSDDMQEDKGICSNAFELLSLIETFNINTLLTPRDSIITKCITSAPRDTILPRISDVLCRMPLTFKLYERRSCVCVQVPFDNGMVVAILQVHYTKFGISVIEFKHWRGDAHEFLRIYRDICDALGNTIMRLTG